MRDLSVERGDGVPTLLWKLARAYARRALVGLALLVRRDRGEITLARLGVGALAALVVIVGYAVIEDKPLTAPTQPWPTVTPTPILSAPVEYVIEFRAVGARVTYASINGEQTPSRSVYVLRAPAALVLTVQGTGERAGSCMIVVDGLTVVEQYANKGNPATCVWLLEEGFTA